MESPPPASVLLGVEIPPVGGDTFFADQREALATLPDSLRARINDLTIKHDAAHDSVGCCARASRRLMTLGMHRAQSTPLS